VLTNIFADPDHAGTIAGVTYHCWWPSPSDPMYLYNVQENAGRVNYYGADYTPHAYFDGNVDGQYFTSLWDGMITSEEAVSSPIQINLNIDHDNATNSGTVEAVISATEPITHNNLYLRIAITESHIPDVPGGSYFDEHNHALRDMLPTHIGNSFSISQGDVVTISEDYQLDLVTEEWENLEITAFVQCDDEKRVLQAATQHFPGLNVSISPVGSSVQVPRGGTLGFEAFLSNNRDNTGNGDFWLTIVLPNGNEYFVPEFLLSGANPYSGSVPGWGSGTMPYDLSIPAGTPTGIFTLKGNIGRYPDTILKTRSFDFEVTP